MATRKARRTATDSTPEENAMTGTFVNAPLDIASLARTAEPAELPASNRQGKFADNPMRDVLASTVETGQALSVTVAGSNVSELTGYLRAAAKELECGSSIRYTWTDEYGDAHRTSTYSEVPADREVAVAFLGKPAKKSGGRIQCPECGHDTSLTTQGVIRTHGARGLPACEGSKTRPAE